MDTIRRKQLLEKTAGKVQDISQQIIALLAEETGKDPSVAMTALLLTLNGMFCIAKTSSSERASLYNALEDSIKQSQRFSETDPDSEQMFDMETELSKAITESVEQVVLIDLGDGKKTTIH
tara:strand:- start:11 stop:373 length:363 start_codon:yes stop_codon:yes gene_type:complete